MQHTSRLLALEILRKCAGRLNEQLKPSNHPDSDGQPLITDEELAETIMTMMRVAALYCPDEIGAEIAEMLKRVSRSFYDLCINCGQTAVKGREYCATCATQIRAELTRDPQAKVPSSFALSADSVPEIGADCHMSHG